MPEGGVSGVGGAGAATCGLGGGKGSKKGATTRVVSPWERAAPLLFVLAGAACAASVYLYVRQNAALAQIRSLTESVATAPSEHDFLAVQDEWAKEFDRRQRLQNSQLAMQVEEIKKLAQATQLMVQQSLHPPLEPSDSEEKEEKEDELGGDDKDVEEKDGDDNNDDDGDDDAPALTPAVPVVPATAGAETHVEQEPKTQNTFVEPAAPGRRAQTARNSSKKEQKEDVPEESSMELEDSDVSDN